MGLGNIAKINASVNFYHLISAKWCMKGAKTTLKPQKVGNKRGVAGAALRALARTIINGGNY